MVHKQTSNKVHQNPFYWHAAIAHTHVLSGGGHQLITPDMA